MIFNDAVEISRAARAAGITPNKPDHAPLDQRAVRKLAKKRGDELAAEAVRRAVTAANDARHECYLIHQRLASAEAAAAKAGLVAQEAIRAGLKSNSHEARSAAAAVAVWWDVLTEQERGAQVWEILLGEGKKPPVDPDAVAAEALTVRPPS